MSPRNWWKTKSESKKQNWLALSLLCCLIAGSFVEYYTWAALIGALPAVSLIFLEVLQ